jgi:hypothetical protein
MEAQKTKYGTVARTALGIAFVLLVLPLASIGLAAFIIHRITLYILIWLLWLSRGKDVLFVYSDSPIWRDYMTQNVLPLVDKRAVVLNWSERRRVVAVVVHRSCIPNIRGDKRFQPVGGCVSAVGQGEVLSLLSCLQGAQTGLCCTS